MPRKLIFILCLEKTAQYAEYLGVRQKWSDGKVQKLENCLDKFIVGLYQAAQAIRIKREEDTARRLRWEEERRAREEQRRLQLIEEKRIEILKSDMAQWREADDIRAYIEVLQKRTDILSQQATVNLAKWCEWAIAYADAIDPLHRPLPEFKVEDVL